jgi:diguanylate cyclase (GGDEF)-like protein
MILGPSRAGVDASRNQDEYMAHDTDHDLTIEIANTLPGTSRTSQVRAYLVHIYPPGINLGTRYILGDLPMLLGRDPKCDICIDDPSISRVHARFQPDSEGISAIDLQSTNGMSVNRVEVRECRLKDGDDVRFGNCIYRFLASSNVEAQYHEEIHRLTIIDVLTHIPNRRHFMQFLERELQRSSRYERPLALVLFDIDHFKAINDRFGHLGGDFTLKELSGLVQSTIRKEGLFARYGGEEFAVVLPEATLTDGMYVAERIRGRIEKHVFEYGGTPFSVTISVGVTSTDGRTSTTADELIGQADARLYHAKRDGRNRVVAEHPVYAAMEATDSSAPSAS